MPVFRKFCKNFLDFRNFVLYKRIGKCTSSGIFSEFQEIYTKVTGISENCLQSYLFLLQVYSGRDIHGLSLAIICHEGHINDPIQHVSTTGNEMFVRFRSDSSVNGRGFNATYEAIAGGKYTSYECTMCLQNVCEAYSSYWLQH